MTNSNPSPAPNLLPVSLSPDWQRAFIDWLTNLSSSRTRRSYLAAWRDFLTVQAAAPARISQSDILAYRVHLDTVPSPRTRQPYSANTINQRLCALSSFFKFAQARQLRSDNPCEGVHRKAVSPYGKATWLDGEAEQDVRLLRTVDTTTLQGKRDYALLLLFLTTAIRVEAAANLRVRSLRYQGQKVYLTYLNKGGEQVEKLLEPLTIAAMEDYLTARAGDIDHLPPDAPLFIPTDRGQQAIAHLPHTDTQARAGQKPLSSRAINKLVRKYCDRLFGPGHGITPHSLRHTAAMNAILEGASVTEVSQLLKHKSMGVTTVYLHATDKDGDKVSRRLGQRYAKRLQDDAE
ncbi:MAG: tyrosine-type recombinase/integrase [Anaerolineae bacterium]|nr:tyrosine-type recombinase/integrase [Anaerolineae bacterium]